MDKRGLLFVVLLLIPSVSALDVNIQNNVLTINGEFSSIINIYYEDNSALIDVIDFTQQCGNIICKGEYNYDLSRIDLPLSESYYFNVYDYSEKKTKRFNFGFKATSAVIGKGLYEICSYNEECASGNCVGPEYHCCPIDRECYLNNKCYDVGEFTSNKEYVCTNVGEFKTCDEYCSEQGMRCVDGECVEKPKACEENGGEIKIRNKDENVLDSAVVKPGESFVEAGIKKIINLGNNDELVLAEDSPTIENAETANEKDYENDLYMELDRDSIKYSLNINKKLEEGDDFIFLGEPLKISRVGENGLIIEMNGEFKTIKDGYAFINEDYDNPSWVWNLESLDTENPIIGIENDFIWNDASDKGILNENNLGCIKLPFDYVSVCFDKVIPATRFCSSIVINPREGGTPIGGICPANKKYCIQCLPGYKKHPTKDVCIDKKILLCNDGTIKGQCSNVLDRGEGKPKYCNEDLGLINNCFKCGCPSKYDKCLPDGKCLSKEGELYFSGLATNKRLYKIGEEIELANDKIRLVGDFSSGTKSIEKVKEFYLSNPLISNNIKERIRKENVYPYKGFIVEFKDDPAFIKLKELRNEAVANEMSFLQPLYKVASDVS